MLLAVIVIAYLITRLVLDRVERRFGFTSGVEQIVLGVLVGPAVGLLSPETLAKFAPALVLGTGSLGLIAGISVDVRRWRALELEVLRVALWSSVATGLTMIALPLALLYFVLPIESWLRWTRGILCVGSIALVAAPGPLASLSRFLGAKGESTEAGTLAAQFCSVIAVLVFGLLFCLFDHDAVFLSQAYSMVEWFGIHLALGALLGFLFAQFLRRGFDDDTILTIVIGMVIFTSGIAYYLRLSPIFVNLILGLVLANTSRHAEGVRALLTRVERPLYIVLFFFAGASLSLRGPNWWLVALCPPIYLIARSIARLVGGALAARTANAEPPARIPSLGRVLLAPGALSVAMLLDFEQVYGSYPRSATIYAIALVAITLSEVFSYGPARSWLLDHTEVAPAAIRRALSRSRAEVS